MKSFQQFIIEALETIASSQAKQMGLRGDGHGDYYDNQGNLVAKTISGKLQIFKGRGGKGPKDNQPKQKPEPKQVQPQQVSQQNLQSPQGTKDQTKGVAVVLGRFNPPARNHEQLLKFGYARSKDDNYDFRVYPSRVQDAGTNPLNPSLKIQFMKKIYPDYADYVVDSEDMKTIFDILSSLYGDGYQNIKIIVGSDRLGEFQSLVHRNQGNGYEFQNIEVLAASVRDPDGDTAGSGSSVALRTSAAEGNYNAFASNLPSRMKRVDKEELYNSVLQSMKMGIVGENYELWRIAPELDMEGLRINYKQNKLYSIGSIVENINTGVRGKVLRRGTNYLICVTESGDMFKSWLQNLHEVHEVGTDEYRETLQKMVDGQSVKSFTGIRVKQTNPKKKLNMNSRTISKVK